MTGIRFKLTDKDRGWAELKKRARQLAADKPHVKVGLVGKRAAKQASGDGRLSMAGLGAVQEFGSEDGRIPARPWIGGSFDVHRAEYALLVPRLVRAILAGELSVKQVLEVLGQRASADTKTFVTQGDQVPPPNAPSTLKRKLAKTYRGAAPGDPRTLIDRGRMVGSVTYEAVLKSGAGGD